MFCSYSELARAIFDSAVRFLVASTGIFQLLECQQHATQDKGTTDLLLQEILLFLDSLYQAVQLIEICRSL